MEENDVCFMRVGPMIRGAHFDIQRAVYAAVRSSGIDKVTAAHGYILKYLSDNSGRDIYQKDIEVFCGMGKSGVTYVLNNMEEAGYITRCSVKRDARLKKICLTEKGIEVNEKIGEIIMRTDRFLISGIPQCDIDCFTSVLERICGNAEKLGVESEKHSPSDETG